MTPSEKYLLHRLQVMESAVARGIIREPPDRTAGRTRYIRHLIDKATAHEAGRELPERDHVAAAEARMAAIREEARQQLVAHSAAPHPAAGTGQLGMMASAAQQAAGANRVRAEGRAWQVASMRREAARKAWAAAAPEGSQIGSHERALAHIARVNP